MFPASLRSRVLDTCLLGVVLAACACAGGVPVVGAAGIPEPMADMKPIPSARRVSRPATPVTRVRVDSAALERDVTRRLAHRPLRRLGWLLLHWLLLRRRRRGRRWRRRDLARLARGHARRRLALILRLPRIVAGRLGKARRRRLRRRAGRAGVRAGVVARRRSARRSARGRTPGRGSAGRGAPGPRLC